MVKEDPVRLELSLTPSYGKNPVIVGLVESLDLVARRDREFTYGCPFCPDGYGRRTLEAHGRGRSPETTRFSADP